MVQNFHIEMSWRVQLTIEGWNARIESKNYVVVTFFIDGAGLCERIWELLSGFPTS